MSSSHPTDTPPSTPGSYASNHDNKNPQSLHHSIHLFNNLTSSPNSSTALSSLPCPLTLQQALAIATQMRTGLAPQTKDRTWHFKTYKHCFKNSHAISWARKHVHPQESICVQVLNQLVSLGLVCHVVDPHKKFRVEDTRTLYFRVVEEDNILYAEIAREILENSNEGHNADDDRGGENNEHEQLSNKQQQQQQNHRKSISDKSKHLINGSFGSIMERKSIESLQTKIENIDHVLQETVQELNDVHGKLEIVHQQVLSLVSQQFSMLAMVLSLYIYIMFILVPSVPGSMGWFSIPGILVTVILGLSTKCGLTCIGMWSHLDSNKIVPLEAIITDDESTDATATTTTAPASVVDGLRHASSSMLERPSSKNTIGSLLSRSIGARSLRGSLGETKQQQQQQQELFMRDSYSLPEVATWPNRPILICMNTPVSPNFKVPEYDMGPCPLGKPFKFSSELFEGTCLIRIKGAKNSDNPQGDLEYFSGKKRIFQSIVQGRFKEEVRVSEVLTGHEFSRPLKNLPHPWVLKTASNFIAKVAPGANVVVHTDQPKVEAILAGTSQVLRGDEPGNEPNITTCNIQEDCSVLGGTFAKGNVSISRRKRLLSNPERSKSYMFDTETIYTFEFYQNLFDANTYSLDLGFAKIGCSKVLDGQPIQWLGKMRDGRYLWSFQVWHEKLLSEQNEK